MAKIVPAAVAADQDYLIRTLDLRDLEQSDSAIKICLQNMERKLSARFSANLSEVSQNPEEKNMQAAWERIKKNFHEDILSPYGYQIVFKPHNQKAEFEQLVAYASKLVELDADLKGALNYIATHPAVNSAHPHNPAWLQVAKKLCKSGNFFDPANVVVMTSSEIKSMVEDIKPGVERAKADQVAALKTSKMPEVGRDISLLGCRWVKVTKTEGKLKENSGHIKGQFKGQWEPQIEGSRYKRTSLFALPKIALIEARENILQQANPNADKLNLLDKLIDTKYNEDARWSLLKELQRKYPPPQ